MEIMDSVSVWIIENFGSFVGFVILLLLFVVPLVVLFSARIAYIFNIGGIRDNKVGSDLESSGKWPGFFKALGRGDAGGGGGEPSGVGD